MSDNSNIAAKKRRIRVLTIRYILGCFFFVAVALSFIAAAVLILMGKAIPHGMVIFSIGGVVLLCEMLGAMNMRPGIPKDFHEIDENQYPALFRIGHMTKVRVVFLKRPRLRIDHRSFCLFGLCQTAGKNF